MQGSHIRTNEKEKENLISMHNDVYVYMKRQFALKRVSATGLWRVMKWGMMADYGNEGQFIQQSRTSV